MKSHIHTDGFCLSQTSACVIIYLKEQVGVVRVRRVAQHELEKAHGVGRVVRLVWCSFRSSVSIANIPESILSSISNSHTPTYLARQRVEEVRDEAAARRKEGEHVGLLHAERHGAARLEARLQLVPAAKAGVALQRPQRRRPQRLGRLADAPVYLVGRVCWNGSCGYGALSMDHHTQHDSNPSTHLTVPPAPPW